MEVKMYQTYGNSVGNNFKHVQITTKYRYDMMRTSRIEAFCKIAIEEACKRYGITIVILNVQNNHVHMIVDCPRTMCDAKLIQIIKGLSSYLLFRMCENLRKRYPNGNFWNAGYFCCSVGRDFDSVFSYVRDQ
jgi:putative transposase